MGSIITSKRSCVEERRSALLPTEWQLEILTYLNDKERFKLSVVCSDWWCAAKHLYAILASSDGPCWKIQVTPTTYNLDLNRAVRNAYHFSSIGFSNIQNHPTEKLQLRVTIFGKPFRYEEIMQSRLQLCPCDMEVLESRSNYFTQKPFSLVFHYPKISKICSLSISVSNTMRFADIATYYHKASYISLDFIGEETDQIWLTGHDNLKGLQIEFGYPGHDLSAIAGQVRILSLTYESEAFLTSNFPPTVELLHVDEHLYEEYENSTTYPVHEMNKIKTLVLSLNELNVYLSAEHVPVLIARFSAIINAAPNARKVILPKKLHRRYGPEFPQRPNLCFQYVAMPQTWKLKDLEKFL